MTGIQFPRSFDRLLLGIGNCARSLRVSSADSVRAVILALYVDLIFVGQLKLTSRLPHI